MKILITGGTGFIGRPLADALLKDGHELVLVTRRDRPSKPSLTYLRWNPEQEDCPIDLNSVDAIIHLLGESIAAGRWTEQRKRRIYDSRILSTRSLAKALARRREPLPCLISASAIGFYPYSEEQSFSEDSSPGEHFLAKVCQDWESEVKRCPQVKRELRLRFGVVLGSGGGMLEKVLPSVRLGLGARLGSGQQAMSWIHRDDIIGIVREALRNESYRGAINCVAPQTCTQSFFMQTLASILHRPVFFQAPSFMLKLGLGELSDLLLQSQKVIPKRLMELGYSFRYPELRMALEEIVSASRG